MDILLTYGQGGLGDLLISTPLFKDFAEQHPNDNLLFNPHTMQASRLDEIFKNNPYFKLWDCSSHIDKEVVFEWGKGRNELENRRKSDKNAKYIDNLYNEISKRTGLEVKCKSRYVDLYWSKEEDEIVNNILDASQKPICIVNCGYHPIYTTARNWGWLNFQKTIDVLKDKVDFIQIGSLNGFLHPQLRGARDLVGRTTIRSMLNIMRTADFVLSNDTSTYHVASQASIFKHRVVVTILGAKAPYEWLNCYEPFNVEYELVYNNDKFQQCYEAGEYCCDISNAYETSLGLSDDKRLCKCPSCNAVGQIVPACFNAITVEEVVSRFEKHL